MGLQKRIISHVVDGILSGRFKPGSQLKSRDAFCKTFKTTPVTVQRAFNQMLKDGFVTSIKSSGTFVAECPSCLCRYALVFPSTPQSGDWTFFQKTVLDSVDLIEAKTQVNIQCFLGLGLKDATNELEKFNKAIRNKTLAGAIFVSELRNFHKNAWLNVDLPCYTIAQPYFSQGFPRIELSKSSFYDQAIKKFKALGRKRIALAVTERYIHEWEHVVKDVFQKNELPYCEDLVQSFIVREPLWIERFLKLAFCLPKGKRPDGIFVVDDNFVGQAYRTLEEMGLEIGKDIDFVCHANFPVDLEKYPNVYRLGYNVLPAITSAIEMMRRGAALKDIVVEAEFAQP